MKLKNKILLLLLTISSVAVAQEKKTLQQIMQTIENQNPVAKMYDAQIRSLDETSKGARSWMPTDFGTGFWMTPYNPKLWKGDNGTGGMGQYLLSVQQMFPNKKKQDAEALYMEGMSASEKEHKRYELYQLYADAKKNYYGWVIIKKKINVLNENEKLLNFMIKDAELRYKNGLDKLSAYYKAKAELGNVINQKIELQNEMVQKRIRLNTLMNSSKLETFDIDTSFSVRDVSAEMLDTAILRNRSDLKAIDRDIQLTALQQNVERNKVKPEFGVRYEHMFGLGGMPMQYTLMGMVRIPIGRANRASKANVESLSFKTEALQQQKQMIINEASGMVAGMLSEIEAKKKQVKLFEENIIPALQKNYQVMQLGYEQNTEQLFTLFDAWDTLNKTQFEYLNQVQQLLNMQVELERILEIK
ncbi:TolC family protein [Flavisolibacter nicotianae]|uniref:TolC family protein n=1 Tax=Flavisolibacter nicotianae TaxID=2364882 RepID=UPI000EB2AA62|nr:TolC family protein [Flavisolibacter nicotianae]